MTESETLNGCGPLLYTCLTTANFCVRRIVGSPLPSHPSVSLTFVSVRMRKAGPSCPPQRHERRRPSSDPRGYPETLQPGRGNVGDVLTPGVWTNRGRKSPTSRHRHRRPERVSLVRWFYRNRNSSLGKQGRSGRRRTT